DLMSQLFDLEPDAPEPPPPDEPWEADRVPNDFELVTEPVVSRATDPWRSFRSLRRTGLALARSASSVIGGDDNPAMPFTAPHTIFTGAITPHRVVAFGQADLEDLRHIKTVFECKINDVVLAACTLALRRYLQDHD